MSIVPVALREPLRAAGWFDGRCVSVDSAVPVDHPAYAILAELGGLKLVRDDIVEFDFRYVRLRDQQIARWERALATRLIGIAERHNAHGELYIGGRGYLIGNSIIHPACWFEGENIAEAITNVLMAVRSRPMLLPDDRDIILYGETFRHGDAEVLTPVSPEFR